MRIGKERKSLWKTDVPKLYAYNECEHSVYPWRIFLKSITEKSVNTLDTGCRETLRPCWPRSPRDRNVRCQSAAGRSAATKTKMVYCLRLEYLRGCQNSNQTVWIFCKYIIYPKSFEIYLPSQFACIKILVFDELLLK